MINGLHRDERRLFHDRLRQLDRKVLAGVSKISWAASKSTLDAYCTEALRYEFNTEIHVFGRHFHNGTHHVFYMCVSHVDLYWCTSVLIENLVSDNDGSDSFASHTQSGGVLISSLFHVLHATSDGTRKQCIDVWSRSNQL